MLEIIQYNFLVIGAGQITGGTGINKIGNTLSIDNTVVTVGGAQCLTNKTLSLPDINGGAIDNTIIGGDTPSQGTFTNNKQKSKCDNF